MDKIDISAFEAEFDSEITKDDDSAARNILASGQAIHIAREDTPEGYVVRIHPDGREELVQVDLEALSKLLGR